MKKRVIKKAKRKKESGNLLSFLLGYGTRPNKWGTQ